MEKGRIQDIVLRGFEKAFLYAGRKTFVFIFSIIICGVLFYGLPKEQSEVLSAGMIMWGFALLLLKFFDDDMNPKTKSRSITAPKKIDMRKKIKQLSIVAIFLLAIVGGNYGIDALVLPENQIQLVNWEVFADFTYGRWFAFSTILLFVVGTGIGMHLKNRKTKPKANE